MKITLGIASALVVAVFGGAFAATLQKPTVPDNVRQAAQDPDTVGRRNAYLKVHVVMKPYAVVFKSTAPDPNSVRGKNADLRQQISDYGIKIKNQGDRGTCSVFALNFLQEYAQARKTKQKNINFSEEYLNYIGNLAVGQWTDGGFFTDLNNGYQTWGHAPQRKMPYTLPIKAQNSLDAEAAPLLPLGVLEKKFKATFIKPWDNTNHATNAQLDAACAQLDDGNPVASGLRWPDSGHFVQKEIGGVDMMMYVPASDVYDGHSIDLVGYKKGSQFPGGGYFVFRNSWSTSFGDQGYGYMSFAYCKAYANDMVYYK